MKALIFGGSGQDGSYLIEHLIERGWDVVATRRNTVPPEPRERVRWLWADLANYDLVASAVVDARPDVVYNLAAVTTPGATWCTTPALDPGFANVNALGALRVLRAVERCAPDARVVHASSSAIYAPGRYGLYGTSKVFAHETVKGHRDRGLWASNAVLYSHTSIRQDSYFLVPMICRAAARIRLGADERIRLDSSRSLRDWSHARDVAGALALIADLPSGDYDVASGQQWTPRQVVEMALDGSSRDPDDVIVEGSGAWTVEWPASLGPLNAHGWQPASLPNVVRGMVAHFMTEGKA